VGALTVWQSSVPGGPVGTPAHRLWRSRRCDVDHYRMDMSAPATSADEQLDRLRALVATATHRLLGDTISVTDEQWRRPSRLPEWSRGHVATHLARQADAIVRLTEWARTGDRQDMYASPEERNEQIEAGSGRSGLDLQVDLDESAGRLAQAFESVDEAQAWDVVVEMRGGLRLPARLLPLARMLEVAVHHVDLDVGYEITDLDAPTAEWLLEWCAFRLRNRDESPQLHLTSDSGFSMVLGTVGDPIEVHGTSQNLLGWVLGRTSAVSGADGLRLPGF
jgi:maleylpyruvate isomerase